MAAPPAKAQGEADINDCDCHPNDPTAPICLLQNIRPKACSKSDATSEDCMWCSQFEGVACEGNYVEDFWSCLVFYPVAIAQFTMHATSEGKDMKKYFHSLDSLIQEMADAAEDGNVIPASIQQPVTVVSKQSQETAFA